MYMYGTQFALITVSYVIAIPISAFIFLPVFYKLRVTSVYEYLEMRFDRYVRLTASLVFMVAMIIYMSIVLYAPAISLSAVTGISKWYSIVILGAVCTIYCTIGGIKAVIWTDVFQASLMLAAMLAVIINGSIDVGGVDVVWERANKGGRIQFDNISANPLTRSTIWSVIIGFAFTNTSLLSVNQTQIQRLSTAKTLKSAQIALFSTITGFALIGLTANFAGLVVFATYFDCDPLDNNEIEKSDQLLPYFVIDKLTPYPGLSGLIISGIFSGSLSSISSFVNSCAAITLEDYIKPYYIKNKSLSERTQSTIVKLLALFYGLLCISLTFVMERANALTQTAFTIFGVIGGPLLGLFTAGVCFKCCNSIGSLIGFLISLAFGCWLGFGSIFLGEPPVSLPRNTIGCDAANITQVDYYHFNSIHYTLNNTDNKSNTLYVYNISYMWLSLMTWFIGLLVSLIVSSIVGPKPKFDLSLLSPMFRPKINYDSDETESITSINLIKSN